MCCNPRRRREQAPPARAHPRRTRAGPPPPRAGPRSPGPTSNIRLVPLGVDVGGGFTDGVLAYDGWVLAAKAP
ncbi:MAG: hypothetical protein ACR2LV_11770, partial [Solirubrobacteraceae bacterium]